MNLDTYYDYYNNEYISGDLIYEIITIENMLFYEEKNDIKFSSFFKVYWNLIKLEEDIDSNHEEISYIYSILAYYIGFISTPNNSDDIAKYFINQAKKYTNSKKQLEEINKIEKSIFN